MSNCNVRELVRLRLQLQLKVRSEKRKTKQKKMTIGAASEKRVLNSMQFTVVCRRRRRRRRLPIIRNSINVFIIIIM